jgi:hypothetical protein
VTRISDVMPESKYDIDSDTGLPVLPEGQRWYVGEHPYRGTFGIGIQRFSPEKTTEKTVANLVPRKKKWWSRKVTFERVEETEIVVVPENWFTTRFFEQLHRRYLTPETIQETAIRIVLARDAFYLVESLIGAYPPKKLEV